MKNTIAATNVPDSIPLVIVIPINTPSHTNATIPEIGISIAQKMYSSEAEITLSSFVRRRRKSSPPNPYTMEYIGNHRLSPGHRCGRCRPAPGEWSIS